MFLNAGLGVRFKTLLSCNVDFNLPHFHGKRASEVVTVRIRRADGRHLRPFIPLHQFS